MEKFIPYEKLSKKEKRKIDAAKRNTWGDFNPVTRKPQSSKAYNRNKSRNWMRDYHGSNSGMFIYEADPAHITVFLNTWFHPFPIPSVVFPLCATFHPLSSNISQTFPNVNLPFSPSPAIITARTPRR